MCIAPALISTSADEQPFRFLDLPTELRCQVYEYLVVVGKVFYTPDDYAVMNEKRFKDWNSYRAPDLTILRICKQTHNEAEELYLSKNMFVLPDFLSHRQPIEHKLKPDGHILSPNRPLFSRIASRYLKNISISFNPRLPAPDILDHSSWRDMEYQSPAQSFDVLQPRERLELAHEHAASCLVDFWDYEIYRLVTFLPPLEDNQIHHLEIDITNAYCPIGCCRLVESSYHLISIQRPTSVTFVGLSDKGEECRMMQKFEAHYRDIEDVEDMTHKDLTWQQIKKMHDIKFDPVEDVWAKWKMEHQQH